MDNILTDKDYIKDGDEFDKMIAQLEEMEAFEDVFNKVQSARYGYRKISPERVRILYLLYKIKTE